jgi:nucleoside-diphosphate-sugar epimerase
MFTRPDVDKLLTDTVCDVAKIQRVLGFQSQYGLHEGARRTVKWFRQEQPRSEGER